MSTPSSPRSPPAAIDRPTSTPIRLLRPLPSISLWTRLASSPRPPRRPLALPHQRAALLDQSRALLPIARLRRLLPPLAFPRVLAHAERPRGGPSRPARRPQPPAESRIGTASRAHLLGHFQAPARNQSG